jgi:AcrR family transcriptional regulator
VNLREKVLAAARRLAAERPAKRPIDQISISDIAREAGVHWSTARRHLGSKADLKALLTQYRADSRAVTREVNPGPGEANPDTGEVNPSTGEANPDTRTRIILAAARVFSQYGYNGASLDQVAAAAWLTKGAVYWHFSSKSDLFLALLRENVRRQLSILPDDTGNILASPDPEKALAAWFEVQFALCQAHPDGARLFFEFVASSRDPAVRAELSAIFRAGIEGVQGILRRAQDGQMLSPDQNPHALAVLLQALLNGLSLSWLIGQPIEESRALATEIARVLWRGARPG